MDFATNPFIVLSYVSGPALLTNATSLLLLSTTNRFGRSIDRSRVLAARLSDPTARTSAPSLERQMAMVQRRVGLMARALFGLYLSAAMFALATLASIVGAAMAELVHGTVLTLIVAAATVSGVVGFIAFVTAAAAMVAESRLAMRSLALEAADAVALARPPPRL
jgi:hypothetical protein